MVEFGKRLAEECTQHGIEWQNHCIDYNELKNIILEAKQQQQQQQQRTTTSIATATVTATHAKSKSQRNRTVSFDARNEHDFLFTAIRTSGGNDIDNVNDDPLLDDNDNEYSSSLSTSLLISSLQFRYALDREIEKAVLYVLQEQGSIALELDTLAVRRAGYADRIYMLVNNRGGDNAYGSSSVASSNIIIINAALEELQQLHGGYVLVARSVLSFVAFVDLNVTVRVHDYFLLQ